MKLNVRLVVDDRTIAYARDVNARLRALAPGVIVFDDASPMQPHVTVIGGAIQDDRLPALIDAARTACVGHSPLTLHVQPPSIETLFHHWVDSTTEGGPALEALRASLRTALEGTYVAPRDKPWRPHLTLGCIDPDDAGAQERVSAFLATVAADFPCAVNTVEVSESGPEGTVVRSLARIALA